ncbi:guanitoxin biosynthesis MBL fold metallo-hydrolase GntH [Sinorhizobium meliloti]|uniref:guanitoxin biosynthesis MBL fold metallo-hydrolase GntH n=1 Tax=Rhizobium meliloti TaxID=382 RepID=UPI000FDAC261|nr:guanitoxin biosynthesis MBL fold metallo-hydrolase GntH [Sinorhizobium meliloti]RVG73138.1 MBL fold metallo-hydrolase [Sinorhizobium meliloti]
MADEPNAGRRPMSRRDALKTAGLAGAAALSTTAVASAQVQEETATAKNPYGGVPSGGITLPPYYRPTPYLKSNNIYFPGQEEIGPDEMRVSFIGSTPMPVTRAQAGTCIMVELGNGKRFFFDLGSGCVRNIIAMGVPLSVVNDIFFTHLHVDHYADLPYLYAFAPWVGRWKPLRVHGPSGRTPKDGTKAMIEAMKVMTHWHTDSFNACPIGDGYEIEVNEFDFRDDNGICYDQDDVTIRHWRRSHSKDGASAYRLDWNGLSFVWTGDGRPDERSIEFSKDVDVFVTEVQPDIANLQAMKMGMPAVIMTTTIDQAHTPHYAAGYMFNKVQPRLAMVTHTAYDEELIPEITAGIRAHYAGLFQFGAPDVVVVNVTKDAIWSRKAAIPEAGNMARPSPAEAVDLFDLSPANLKVTFPNPRYSVADVIEADILGGDIDPKKYYPPDVYRVPNKVYPKDFTLDVREIALKKAKQAQAKLSAKSAQIQAVIDAIEGTK